MDLRKRGLLYGLDEFGLETKMEFRRIWFGYGWDRMSELKGETPRERDGCVYAHTKAWLMGGG